MLDDAAWFERARGALEDLARATGIAYSAVPKDGALSLFSDHRANVYAMLVTGIDAHGDVERGVTPYGDPPMTAREFVTAAGMAEAAVYAIHQHRAGGRLNPEVHAAASKAIGTSSTVRPRRARRPKRCSRSC